MVWKMRAEGGEGEGEDGKSATYEGRDFLLKNRASFRFHPLSINNL